MTTGDGGLEIDLERKGVKPEAPKRKAKERDWKAIGMTAGKFLSGLAVSLVAAWGALKPETEAAEAKQGVESSYVLAKAGIEKNSEQLAETKAAVSVLTQRIADHLEKFHELDKRLLVIETRFEVEAEIDEGLSEEELGILSELDAIRRELEEDPVAFDSPEPVKTKGHGKAGKPKPAPAPPQIRQEGQQIKLPSPEELFR